MSDNDADRMPVPPPAYLLSLKLQKVFSFTDGSRLDLSDGDGKPAQWTVILGDNGTGKTTLLRCLAAMEPRFWRSSEELSPLPRIFYESTSTPWFGVRELRELDFQLNLTIASGSLLNAVGEVQVVGDLTFHVDEPYDEKLWGSLQPPIIPGLSTVSSNLRGTNSYRARSLIVYGYGATRRMGSTSLSETFASDAAASLFDEQVPLLNAEEWLLQADYASVRSGSVEEGKRLEQRFDRARDVLCHILPDVEDIRIAPATDQRSLPGAEFLTPIGWVPLAGLGLGYRTVIAWIVDFAARMFDRYPNSPDPLAEPAVVLIDEIDLHLHPRWQRQIMGYLSERFPNTQFIATAHSPLVVQAASGANLVLLRRENGQVVIDNDPAVIDNWRVDQILTSVFDLPTSRPPELEPLLAARRELLSKPKLSAADKKRLRQIEEQIGALPTAETASDLAAMDIIRRAAAILEGK